MQITIDLITDQEEMYRALVDSEENQSMIGISCDDLGSGMFMTSVKEINEVGGEIFMVLNSYDSSGYFLEKNRIAFRSVTGVLPFKTVFRNPFLKRLKVNECSNQTAESSAPPDYIF